jgi:pyruvate formate lyase activating enzyme
MKSTKKTTSIPGLPLTRRQFLKAGAVGLGVLACQRLPLPALGQDVRLGYIKPHPAAHFRVLKNGNIRCDLCPRRCEVMDGDRGECGVR